MTSPTSLTDKQLLIMWINSFGKAHASGDANLITTATQALEFQLARAPDTWPAPPVPAEEPPPPGP